MTSLGPYSLLRRIGTGGMGEVWIARRAALGGAAKLVAIKTVLPDKARNPASRRMFLDEARLSMLMSNSNIVQVFDVAETSDGVCYMAMEYVDGIDLALLCEYLNDANEQMSHSVIAYIIGEILKALSYAHSLPVEGIHRAIVHRDISPQNVMLSVSGEVKVMDFGIARLSSEETSGMFVKGKIRYMPPEQFQKGVRAPTLDLFAVGAILHELLDGKRFRSGEIEQSELLGMCLRGEVPPLSCAPARVPLVFEQLREGLLEPVAANRIQSARAAHRMLSRWPGDRDAKFELEELVRRFVGESSLTATTVDPLPVSNDEMTDIRRVGEYSDTRADLRQAPVADRPAPRTRGRRFFGALAGAAGLAVVGLGGLGAWLSSDERDNAAIAGPPTIIKAKPIPPTEPETAPSVEPEPELAPVPVPTTQAATKANSKAKQTKAAQTLVAITAGGVWAQVKIGRKRYTFDRLKGTSRINARFEPGEYKVSFRDDPEDAWTPLGRVHIPTDGSITLDVRGGNFTVGK